MSPKLLTLVLCLVFFLSGASALIFEALWFQLCGYTFGNSVWASSIVLSSFMGGLALGNAWAARVGRRLKRPLRAYAFLEVMIAVSGVLIVLGLPTLTPVLAWVFREGAAHPVLLNGLRGFLAFAVLLLPSTAMGATLPVLVKALYARSSNFGRVLGGLYGWNTLGAVAGVLVAEAFFVPWFGLRGASFVAGGLNGFAALVALWLSTRLGAPSAEASVSKVEPSGSVSLTPRGRVFLAASFLSGFLLLSLEVVWFRFLLLFFIAHSWNFAIMLAGVLLGISIGGLLASVWFRRVPSAHRALPVLFFGSSILVAGTYRQMGTVLEWTAQSVSPTGHIWAATFALIFPVCVLSGLVFTMLGKALHLELGEESKSAGWLTLANTLGGMVGGLFGGLVFLPGLGLELSFFTAATGYVVAGGLVLVAGGLGGARLARGGSGLFLAGAAVLLVVFPFGRLEEDYVVFASRSYAVTSRERRVAYREGLTATVQYLEKDLLGEPYYHRLVTNNHSMSGTWRQAKRYMKLFVYWPVAIHPSPEKALLICFGCGSTAKALTDTPQLQQIDVVDISQEVVDLSSTVFPDPEENPLSDERVEVHIEDGRFYLLTTDEQYDIITAEPPPPKHSGIVNLYSQEFFELIYDRLRDGGVVTYWLPVYQLKVEETKSILQGFREVFGEGTSLWTGSGLEWMMVGIKNPEGSGRTTEQLFSSQWDSPRTGPELRALGFESAEQLGSLFLADGEDLAAWIGEAPPLVDNHPRRLLHGTNPERSELAAYGELMAPDRCRESFAKSRVLSGLWPEGSFREAMPHFRSRATIDALLGVSSSVVQNPTSLLHRSLEDPNLKSYASWALGSDEFAAQILREKLDLASGAEVEVEDREILVHLAALAVQEGRFVEADGYLARSIASGGGNPDQAFGVTVYRMYFLCRAGKRGRAREVGEAYIRSSSEGRARRRAQVDTCWGWLDASLGS